MIVYHRFSSVEIRCLLFVVMPFDFCSDQAEEKLSHISAIERERPVYCKVAGCRCLGLLILIVGSLSLFIFFL